MCACVAGAMVKRLGLEGDPDGVVVARHVRRLADHRLVAQRRNHHGAVTVMRRHHGRLELLRPPRPLELGRHEMVLPLGESHVVLCLVAKLHGEAVVLAWCRVQGSGFGVWGLGFRAKGWGLEG